jgi:hypothetical protein
MRIHIVLPEEVVRDLDRRVGPRGRGAFIVRAVEQALGDEHRWELIESSLGSIVEGGHEWDEDPSAWVRRQRRLEERRVG